jgi:hypothetical protein
MWKAQLAPIIRPPVHLNLNIGRSKCHLKKCDISASSELTNNEIRRVTVFFESDFECIFGDIQRSPPFMETCVFPSCFVTCHGRSQDNCQYLLLTFHTNKKELSSTLLHKRKTARRITFPHSIMPEPPFHFLCPIDFSAHPHSVRTVQSLL